MFTLVIIKGNPKYLEVMGKEADAFYDGLKRKLTSMGYSVSFDAGAPSTVPKKANVWIGHSRGIDRLKYAPKQTTTIALSNKSVDGLSKLHYQLSKSDQERILELSYWD